MNMTRRGPAVAILTSLAGALLVLCGVLLANGEAGTALWLSIVPGVVIELAFALARRVDRALDRTAPPRWRIRQEALALFSGTLIAAGGAVGAGMDWLLAAPLLVAGTAVIDAALALHDRCSTIHPGRFTADANEEFVVFLIGMRFNRPLLIHRWLPVALAMPRMLRVLDEHPELGCLGYHQWGGRTTVMVQYWKDFDSLDRFARDGDLPHLEPWRAFNRVIRDSGTVGVWHETYRVEPGSYEAVYANMPAFGLAAATSHAQVATRGDTAAQRLGVGGRSDAPR